MNGDLFSRIGPTTLVAHVGALLFAALIVGCPSTATDTPTDGDAGPDTDAAIDTGPPCSRMTTPCGANKACKGAPDCASGLCRDNLCHDVAPADGVKNGDETDVDCGGTKAPACGDNKGCVIAPDCTSSVCVAGICQPPSPTDGVQNGDETGKDCGGAKAPKCPAGEGCNATADCDKIKCDTVNKKCLPAAHDDGILNLDETGIDCGGPTMTVARCATGEGCVATTDCNNVLCNGMTKLCDPPTSTDGLANGTETDKDCGGGAPTNAPKCVIDQKCKAGTDCTSGGCSVGLGNKCTLLSCATSEVAGISSCGAKETGDPAAVHESCCKSLVLPTRTMKRLDKYEITAGRFRSFLTAIGPTGNVRAWVQAYVAANPTSQLSTMLASFPSLASLYPAMARFDNMSLTAHMSLDIDNYNGIRGCANYNGSYSANTYWQDYDLTDFGLPKRPTPRAVSDEKSLNCAMPIMFAAFCAWDGGEMPVYADYLDVWTQAFPWGPTDLQRPNYNWCNGPYNNGGFTCQCAPPDGVHPPIIPAGSTCPAGGFMAPDGEKGIFYEFPLNTDRSKDNEPLIASPGRMQTDATALTSNGESWYDIFANLAEYTGDFAPNPNSTLATFCDLSAGPIAGQPTCTRTDGGVTKGPGTLHTGIPQIGMVGNSWEGHQYFKKSKASSLPATFQYGKFGARCVRPATPY
jgi:hypothetical protein